LRGREEFDITRDPPPDLVIEIDVTRDSLDRLPTYAALRVGEVWRYDGATISVHPLGPDGHYRESQTTPTFPDLPVAGLKDFLEPDISLDYLSVIREFRAWVRQSLDKTS
jgi:Uma2 family endonuclease